MNSENFHEYLKNPSMLHQVSYQELKSLVLQYPYSPNLRYLLMVKSLFDQNKDYDRNLTLAAMFAPDRKKLLQLVKQNTRLREIHENYELNEEFLELKDLSSLEEVLENQPVSEEQTPGRKEMTLGEEPAVLEDALSTSDEEDPEFLEDEEDLDFLEELLDDTSDVEGGIPGVERRQAGDEGERKEDSQQSARAVEEPEDEPSLLEHLLNEEPAEPENKDAAPESPPAEEEMLHIVPEGEDPPTPEGHLAEGREESEKPKEITAKEPTGSTSPAPLPKEAFTSWRKGVQPEKRDLFSSPPQSLPPLNRFEYDDEPEEDDFDDDYPEEEAQQVARQSVQEDAEIVSETLAMVLEKQGHYQKAIAMYEKLVLQNPEKSSFFAAKIENLKKLIG